MQYAIIAAAFIGAAVAAPGWESTTCTDEQTWTTSTVAAVYSETEAPAWSETTCTDEWEATSTPAWTETEDCTTAEWTSAVWTSTPVAPVWTSEAPVYTSVSVPTWAPAKSGSAIPTKPWGTGAPRKSATGTSWAPVASNTLAPYTGAGNALNAAGLLAGAGAVAAILL